MTLLKPVMIALALTLVTSEGRAMGPANPEHLESFTDEWSRDGVVAWLDRLRRNPGTTYRVTQVPARWVQDADLPRLFDALGSTEPAATVCYLPSAHLVPASFRSTLGHEAARILSAVKANDSYPRGCSDLEQVDVDELRRWQQKRPK